MSMSDPIADMIARIRNAQMREFTSVRFPDSKIKRAILDVLQAEGYIDGYSVEDNQINMQIKYYAGRPVIERMARVSKPGLRQYRSVAKMKPVSRGWAYPSCRRLRG